MNDGMNNGDEMDKDMNTGGAVPAGGTDDVEDDAAVDGVEETDAADAETDKEEDHDHAEDGHDHGQE